MLASSRPPACFLSRPGDAALYTHPCTHIMHEGSTLSHMSHEPHAMSSAFKFHTLDSYIDDYPGQFLQLFQLFV